MVTEMFDRENPGDILGICVSAHESCYICSGRPSFIIDCGNGKFHRCVQCVPLEIRVQVACMVMAMGGK